MKHTQHTMRRGFTFIEVLLYMGIVSLMLTAIVSFAWVIIDAGVKSATQQEVYATTRYVSERLMYEIRNAAGIDVSDFDVNLASDETKNCSLAQEGTSESLRIFVSNNQVFMRLPSLEIVPLQSTDTKVTNLTFTDYSSGDSKAKYVGFVLTVESNYPGAAGRQEYQESVTIRSGVEVRSH
ncbi:MAG: prepilin-type N-terminal cleavage/methylation domain-containing protein [Candidatus Moranbacteria bacterium]|nr:prepilin-type N-terminal cleavage/methylation domain-containing protein [Candidatus Moranbacteria bacterium]